MANYRVEVWITHKDDEAEDFLEQRILDLCNQNGMRVQGGPTVYRMYYTSETIHDRT